MGRRAVGALTEVRRAGSWLPTPLSQPPPGGEASADEALGFVSSDPAIALLSWASPSDPVPIPLLAVHVFCRSADPSGAPVRQVGNRCEVNPGGKRGEVRFLGKIPAIAPGWWVGVLYDEPVGKNDGSVKGQRFFECAPPHPNPNYPHPKYPHPTASLSTPPHAHPPHTPPPRTHNGGSGVHSSAAGAVSAQVSAQVRGLLAPGQGHRGRLPRARSL